jgi:RNA polymerase sigma-70 factor (ECF subfamily)
MCLHNKNEQRDQDLARLMELAQKGDSEAYKVLLKQCQVIIKAYLTVRLGSAPALEDLVQETLIAIHKAKHTYDPRRNFGSWMITIAKYKYIDHIRKWQKQASKETVDEEVLNNLIAHSDQTGQGDELNTQLQSALSSLPEKQNLTVTLLKIEGLSVKEVSEKTGLSEANVKVTAHRAYKILRKKLREYYEQ